VPGPTPGIVALLFTDLVGSTPLYDRLGDEAAEQLRRDHFALLRDTIGRHGGTEIKSVGDGLMVSFTSAVAAVAAATDLQRAVHARSAAATPDGERLDIRVGIHVGEPMPDEDDLFGISVNVARRLCDSAGGGQILASDLVRALVAPRSPGAFRSVGKLHLKGVAEPLEGFEVAWTPVDDGTAGPSLPFPPLLQDAAGAGPFVGRADLLQRAERAWKEASAASGTGEAQRRVVLIGAEAGMGKTRLAAELGRVAHAAGGVVLAGRSDPELTVPYQSITEALAPLARHRDGGSLGALSPSAVDGGETRRHELFDAVSAALAGVGRPVLLVLDDVHWADESTLLLVRHLLRTPTAHGLLLVLTYRPADAASGTALAGLLADLRREEGVEHLAVEGLSLDDIQEVLASTASDGLDDRARAVIQLVADATGGNALFVIEVLRSLVDNGSLQLEEHRWTAPSYVERLAVPDGVQAIVSRRFATLPTATQDVLRAASVVGREFDVELAARLADVAVDVVLDAVDAAIAGDLVRPMVGALDRVEFTHALMRDAVYEDLAPGRRLRLHRALAERLVTTDAPPADIAHHWLAAGPAGDPSQAARWCYLASRVALTQQAAYEDALRFAERGLEVVPASDVGTRGELLAQQGETLLMLDRNPEADARIQATLAAVEAIDPTAELGVLARAFSYVARMAPNQRFEGSDEWTDRVGAELLVRLPHDHPLRPRVLAVRALRDANLDRISVDEADALLATTRDAGDPEALGYALIAAIDVRRNRPVPAVRRRLSAELASLAETWTRYLEVASAIRMIVPDLEVGDRDAAEDDLRLLRTSSFARDAWTHSAIRTITASLAALDGRFAEAERLTNEVLRDPDGGLPFVGAVLFFLAMHRGETDRMLPLLDEARRGRSFDDATLDGALAVCLARSADGDHRLRARSLAGDLLRGLAAAHAPPPPNQLAFVAEAVVCLGDGELAAELEPRLAGWSGCSLNGSYNACFGAADHWLGQLAAILGRRQEADGLLAAAHAFHRDRLRSPVLTAATAAAWSAVRASLGDGPRAAALADEARALAEELGLRPVLERLSEG
jgi:class 3 adenylate cyclase